MYRYKRMQVSRQKRRQKNEPNLPRSIVYLWSKYIEPKFKAFEFLPYLGRESWAGSWIQHSKQQLETIRVLITIQSRFLKASSNDWTSIKLKTDEPAKHQIPTMYSTVSRNYKKVFQHHNTDFVVDLDFDRYMAGSLKRSSHVFERTRREPKLAFKLVLPVQS